MSGSAGTVQRLTAPGRSAIAVIRISGQLEALDIPTSLFHSARDWPNDQLPLVSIPVDAIRFGRWGEYGEEVVVCRTSEHSVEVTCHGGEAAVAKVLADVEARGFARWQAERIGMPYYKHFVPLARTQRTAEILLSIEAQHPGDMPPDARSADPRWIDFGRHLIEPWEVAICGRPNVGKSSLMNAIAGFTRSIVSPTAGTTRDLVTLETAIDGWPVRLTDTAGVRETNDPIENEGVSRARHAIQSADLVIVVLDGSQPLTTEDRELIALPAKRQLIVRNKCDLNSDAAIRAEGSLPVSAATGQGLTELLSAISQSLVPELPPEGTRIPMFWERLEITGDPGDDWLPPETKPYYYVNGRDGSTEWLELELGGDGNYMTAQRFLAGLKHRFGVRVSLHLECYDEPGSRGHGYWYVTFEGVHFFFMRVNHGGGMHLSVPRSPENRAAFDKLAACLDAEPRIWKEPEPHWKQFLNERWAAFRDWIGKKSTAPESSP